MKKLILNLFLLQIFIFDFALAQQNVAILKQQLAIAKHDTIRVLLMADITWAYQYSNPDSAFFYGKKAELLADKIKFPAGKVRVLGFESNAYIGLGNLPKALELGLKALQIADDNQVVIQKAVPLNSVGLVYLELKDYSKSLFYIKEMLKICISDSNKIALAFAELQLGTIFQEIDQLDSASYYINRAGFHLKQIGVPPFPQIARELGNIQFKLGNFPAAMANYKKSISLGLSNINSNRRNLSFTYIQIANLFKKLNQRDSSIYYAKKGLIEAKIIDQKKGILESATFLAEQYDTINPLEALRYYKIASIVKDNLFGAGNILAIQSLISQEEARQKEIENAKLAYKNQLKQYIFLAGLGILLLIAFFLFRNNQKEKKVIALLQEKNEEINLQKNKAEKNLTQLKSTQAQLIQSEKLASLGELTAGIAHEIQNPLNFVNNFSEVSEELIVEILGERKKEKGERDKALEEEILGDLKENLSKINHHGKRASSIVKGMLEHSRTSTGQKELTDINALVDEYLRLAYHGLRAKDKDFNADFAINFDENLPKIEVIPQDIGRVLLNLINNAFYAVNERRKKEEVGYEPKVNLSTQLIANSQLLIAIKDNGVGMSEAIMAKIFQPFFTTKPTGEGTGLGLSLAYDIVTKGHGGKIEVESVEGEGTTFTVKIYVNKN